MNKQYNYIIGDIHGCYEELIELEEKINNHAKENNVKAFIISCGDLIDRGPYSKEVLEHFIKGEKEKSHLAILGNHELMMIRALHNILLDKINIKLNQYIESYREEFELSKLHFGEASFKLFVNTMDRLWLYAGGKETLNSFGIKNLELFTYNKAKEIENTINYLLNLPFFYESNTFFVTHAIPNPEDLDIVSLINKKDENKNKNNIFNKITYLLKKEDEESLSKEDFFKIKKSLTNIVWSKKRPKSKIHEKLNISGHTVFSSPQVINNLNAIQIDTGCVYGNKLTSYCIETNSFLEVSAKKQYAEK